MTAHAVLVTVSDRPGMLFGLTGVLANHQANITYVDMHSGGALSDIYFEFTLPDDAASKTVLPRSEERSTASCASKKRRR